MSRSTLFPVRDPSLPTAKRLPDEQASSKASAVRTGLLLMMVFPGLLDRGVELVWPPRGAFNCVPGKSVW